MTRQQVIISGAGLFGLIPGIALEQRDWEYRYLKGQQIF